MLPSYSIAIRTLGTAGELFRRGLDSIAAQTVPPERVIVYIAEGYSRPTFTRGKEEYVWVKKGMVAQRALPYDEIGSECILMLDDDVELAPDSAERLIKALTEHGADCVGADVFQNHRMPLRAKLFAALTNLVFPHWSRKWAFKVHRSGSFSYQAHPRKAFYWSQSCGGPAWLWRKDAFAGLRMADECWLDRLGFAYGDDLLEAYKLYRNNGRLGILYDAGITHLDAQSSSGSFRKSRAYIYVRTKAQLMIWYRSLFRNGKDTAVSRCRAGVAYLLKVLWMIPVIMGAALLQRDRHYIGSYFKGLCDGWKEVHAPSFRQLPPYIL
ncbi:MAG: glycosyltransferase family 2 protein [Bacteroidales bacterium]|nr:glycosyltransferase family 2 protein [Bacteroidales bacterium]